MEFKVEVIRMIYKLFNYLKSVSVEGEHGMERLQHEMPYYQNEHVCVEVKENAHNDIQVRVTRANYDVNKVILEFINPMENMKAQLNPCGESQPYQPESQLNQCYICSDWGIYALGIEQDQGHQASFTVTPTDIRVEIPVSSSDLSQCYHVLFEKYLTVHSNQEIVSRFKHQLGYSVAN